MSMEAEMEQPVIEFRNVEMHFGPKVVLDRVSFSVAKGETLAVIGPSGTGKSTVLKLLIGLLKPQEGQVVIQGQPVEQFNEEQWNQLRQHMGMVFQYSALFDFLDVGENVAFGLRQHTSLSEEAIQKRVKDLLEAVPFRQRACVPGPAVRGHAETGGTGPGPGPAAGYHPL